MRKFQLVFLGLAMLFAGRASGEGLTYEKGSATPEEVQAVRDQVGDFVSSFRGITGSMITACEAKSGLPFYQFEPAVVEKSEFAYCVVFFTDQKVTKDALDALFPAGTKFKNVFLPVELQPVVVFEPQ